MANLDLTQFSENDIKAALAKRSEAQKDKKRSYEKKREATVQQCYKIAATLQQEMMLAKSKMLDLLDEFKEEMKEYTGTELPEGISFTLTSKDNLTKVVYQTQETNYLDERADQGAERLASFLTNMVKKSNKVAYDLITNLLEKRNGKYDPRLIVRLFQYENEYENEDWKEAIRLFKESVQKGGRAAYMRVYVRENEEAAWRCISLDFAAL